MARSGKILIYLSSGLLLAANIRAIPPASAANPYEAIVVRNVFNVRMPPIDPKVPPPAARPKITLTGVATFMNSKRALMNVQFPAGPGGPAREKSYMLHEGEGQDTINVLSIDEAAGSVKLTVDGIPEEVSFVKNGSKGPSVAAPVSIPFSSPGGPAPVSPAYLSSPNPGASVTTIGASGLEKRPLRLPTGSTTSPGAPGGGGRLGVSSSATVANKDPNTLSYEEQMVLIELERERTKDQVIAGKLPPLPPTPITPPGAPGSIKPAPPPPPP